MTNNRPRRYKRYLDDPELDVPKRTRNRWKATCTSAQEADYEGDADIALLGHDREDDFAAVLEGTHEPQPVELEPLEEDGEDAFEDALADAFEETLDDAFEDHLDDLFEDALEDVEHVTLDGEEEVIQPLYEGASITELLSTMAITAFALRHSLTKVAVRDLLQLINLHMPVSCLPETFYLFSKNFDERTKEVEFHAYCKDCLGYLGTNSILSCEVCGTEDLQKTDLVKDGSYFIYLPLTSQLQDILETPSLAKYFQDDEHINLIWNCDGMPAFQSGKGSVWPIQCSVKALPSNVRKKHMMISGLWFGKSKPQFSTFLKPFVEECRKLSDTGVLWRDSTEVDRHTRVVASECACDSVARCQLQGITQFNGHFGCAWCLHEGIVVPKGRGHVMTYPYAHPPPEERSQRVMEEQAIRLNTGLPPEKGVKQISPLLVLPGFDIVEGFPVDYMHAVCEGVVEQLLNLWFDRAHHQKQWYIGDRLDAVDERIAGISPPSDVTRLPRSPSQRAHWKASEFRSWILFYSLPVLKGILPTVYFAHMLLLVHAIWVLLQGDVKEEAVSLCEIILVKFVIQMKELYGAHNMSYNVHLLLHLGQTVRNCGPLWDNSCFPFEGYNRQIKSLFHGTRYVQSQIAQNFTLLRVLRGKVERLPPSVPRPILSFIKGLLRGYPIVLKALSLTYENTQVLLIGNPCNYTPSVAIRNLLQPYFVIPIDDLQFQSFASVVLNGRIFKVSRSTGRRKDCYVSYGAGKVGEIKNIFRACGDDHGKVTLLLSEKRVKKCNFGGDEQTGAGADHISLISEYRQEVYAVKLVSTKFAKCVTAKFDNKMYSMALPNAIELD